MSFPGLSTKALKGTSAFRASFPFTHHHSQYQSLWFKQVNHEYFFYLHDLIVAWGRELEGLLVWTEVRGQVYRVHDYCQSNHKGCYAFESKLTETLSCKILHTAVLGLPDQPCVSAKFCPCVRVLMQSCINANAVLLGQLCCAASFLSKYNKVEFVVMVLCTATFQILYTGWGWRYRKKKGIMYPFCGIFWFVCACPAVAFVASDMGQAFY